MASKFVPLEEAAKLLGIPTENLVEMRSNGGIRGFKDGASWKFPQDEIDRLIADGVGDSLSDFGSSELVMDQGVGSGSNIIGGEGSGVGSDLEIGGETLTGGSDVALVANQGDDSDVQIVANLDDSDGSSSDSVNASVDDDDVDLSIDLSLGGDTPSDGVDIDLSLADDALSDPNEINLSSVEPSTGGSDLELALDVPSDGLASGINLSDSAINPPDIALDGGSDPEDSLGDLGLDDSDEDIDLSADSQRGGSANDVLSELDLMSADQGGSGDLITGDSGASVLGGSGLQTPISGSQLSQLDDALDDDDDLVISDDDDDLVLGSAGSDVSVVGDSGINLMSPSDSGLSLESEPLDLAGSSISALDLGAEGTDGGTPGSSAGSRAGSSGSLVDFKADEEFQLSPSGIGLEVDDDSGSQVIEVEDSESFSGAMDLGEGEMLSADAGLAADPDTGEGRGWAQRNELLADDAQGIDEAGLVADPVEDEIIVDDSPAPQPAPVAAGYEVPFSIYQVGFLGLLLSMLSLGGMLMTDLVRNLWTYSEANTPVSSLTEAILSALGLNG